MDKKSNLLRVTQINAVYLDKEILRSFETLIQECTKYLPPGFTAPYESEIQLLVKLALLYYSIVKHGCTFGQNLLAIKYENMSYTKRFLYVVGSCLEYIKHKSELNWFKNDISTIVTNLEMFIHTFNLINLTLFLRNGTKPRLIERALNLSQSYVNENTQRQFHSKYLERELLWNGFIEILVFALPFINYHKLRRILRNLNFFQKPGSNIVPGHLKFTLYSKCAHCSETPIQPHHMGCEHVFCYFCLKANQTADEKYQCPICDFCGSECSPVTMESVL